MSAESVSPVLSGAGAPSPHPVTRSSTLLRAARTGDEETVRGEWGALAGYDSARLATHLTDEAARTAFWLNVYNAAVQHELRTAPETYDSRLRFFVANRVTVAGKRLSLNDIEHGILRRSKSVFFLGYGPRLLQSRFERRHHVPSLDSRVHFALNCGAASDSLTERNSDEQSEGSTSPERAWSARP